MRFKINLDKTPQKVTKDPRRAEQGKKSYTRMKRLKEITLEDNQLPTFSTSSSICDPIHSTSSPKCDPKPFTFSSTCDPTPSASSHATNGTYVYGIGILAILAIGPCAFFAYYTFPKNKKRVNEKQNQPPKRRHMLQKNIYNE